MKDWKIATRITVGFTSVLILTIALGVFACLRMFAVRQSAHGMQSNVVPWVQALERDEDRLYLTHDLLLDHDLSSDARERDRLESQMEGLRPGQGDLPANVEALAETPEEAALYEAVKADRVAFWATLEQARRGNRNSVTTGSTQQHMLAVGPLRAKLQKYRSDLHHLVDLHRDDTRQGLTLIGRLDSLSNMGILLLFLLLIAIAVVVNLLIVQGIAAPLRKTVAALDQMAAGDLTPVMGVQSADELGEMAQSLDAALTMLRSTLLEVAESADTSNIASHQLAASAEEIANGAQLQAASLEETSVTLEQITAAVQLTAENAQQASQLATGCRESAEKGQTVVSKAVGAMADINTASAKISDIISTINEIAFQTNLLAVNAAVEAARAGEEGRGFAVVAAEVRSLAQRSADASKDIRRLIEDTLDKVEKGYELVNDSGATLEGIVASVKRVTEIVGRIAAASSEQSISVMQVHIGVTQLDQITQSNSTQTEELAATAQAFAQQSARLKALVHRFKLKDEEGRDEQRLHGMPANGFAKPAPYQNAHRQAARSAASLAGGKFALPTPHRGPPAAVLTSARSGRPDDGSFEEF